MDTYEEFAESNLELLKSLPAPTIAKTYYENDDMYVFDEFQTGAAPGSRRPKINTLYDVFVNIAEDESAHVATMHSCQDESVVLRSPNREAAIIAAAAAVALLSAVANGQFDGLSELSSSFLSGDIQSDGDTLLKTAEDSGEVFGTGMSLKASLENLLKSVTQNGERDLGAALLDFISSLRL